MRLSYSLKIQDKSVIINFLVVKIKMLNFMVAIRFFSSKNNRTCWKNCSFLSLSLAPRKCFFTTCTNKSRGEKCVSTRRISIRGRIVTCTRTIDKFHSRFPRQLVRIIKITRLNWCLQKQPAYQRSSTMTV